MNLVFQAALEDVELRLFAELKHTIEMKRLLRLCGEVQLVATDDEGGGVAKQGVVPVHAASAVRIVAPTRMRRKMATNVGRMEDRGEQPIYFPLDQGERAAHLNVNELLPRDLYNSLAALIKDSVPTTRKDLDTEKVFSETRGHSAIFIDGGRGTGKTTVAVNLREFMSTPESKSKHGALSDDVHVLKPIDPTQLEDSEDMFLNVIVAAVLSDEDIKKALEHSPEKRQRLHEKLQRLGEALEGRESRTDGMGLDRLRSFMGSQALALAVHNFFVAALDLLGKRLLAMPIDDVDTTLHKAFDYLEVVRRYLSSAVVLPIVCGDLRLYMDVTQRDAFRRLTKDMPSRDDEAQSTTAGLAVEYLRKILPVQRRLQMPDISTIVRDDRILLRSTVEQGATARVSMPQFWLWLNALLAGPVNGHENSELTVPIHTVRALAQLASSVRNEFPLLDNILFGNERPRPSTDLVRRLMRVLNGAPVQPRLMRSEQTVGDPVDHLQPEGPLVAGWGRAMLEHFRFVPEAGQACLILLASRHWREHSHLPVFQTPLFSPLISSEAPELRYSDRPAAIAWRDELKDRIAESWLADLPTHLILPFATPEIGSAVRLTAGKSPAQLEGFQKRELALTLGLVVHRNFYSQGQQADLLYTGRVLELVVTSLVRDVSAKDIERILREPPFHSVTTIARTKAIAISSAEEEEPVDAATDKFLQSGIAQEDLQHLASEINSWRIGQAVSQLALSPWLIYCALNKTLNQAAFFNRPRAVRQQPIPASWAVATQVGLAAFNAFWASLASFEKGPVFGLPLVLSNVNLTLGGDFRQNPLYLQNIKPLETQAVVMSSEGEQVLSVTRILGNHPLSVILNGARDLSSRFAPPILEDASPPPLARGDGRTPREELLGALGLRPDRSSLRVASIINALMRNAPNARVARARAEKIHDEFLTRPGIRRELDTLQRAINELRQA